MNPYLRTLGESTPSIHNLEADKVNSLGRNRQNAIVLHDKHASRFHAEIVFEAGDWIVRDCDTVNGTRVNNKVIRHSTALCNGDEIRIGDTRFLFTVNGSNPEVEALAGNAAAMTLPRKQPDPHAASTCQDSTDFQQDELTALCSLLAGPVDDATPRSVVTKALAVVHQQTGAGVVGFLSLDSEEPLPKIVFPELTHVDVHLSRRLTQRVQREGKLVWLGSHTNPSDDNESLLSFTDAICVPLVSGSMTLGALHVYKVGKHFSEREVRFCRGVCGYLGNCLHVLRSRRQLEAENLRLRSRGPSPEDLLVGDSAAMQKVRQQITRMAPRNSNLLIVGESGVGKELVALSIHRQSLRRDGPLITVNCAAIASHLMESELFGHRKGAYTGAVSDRKGLFEQADEGTLFLDEIGELSLECQAKLLRVIEGKGFQQLGGESEIKTDVRVVAATNRDLEEQVRDRKFRQDLYFRLGIPLRVPALREHAEDIPALVEYFLKKLDQEYHRHLKVTPESLAGLQDYRWPGNVRQLRSVLEHAVAMTEGDVIELDDLSLPSGSQPIDRDHFDLNLEKLEAWAISRALLENKSNLSQAAKVLGIHRDTLAAKMKKYGIEKDSP